MHAQGNKLAQLLTILLACPSRVSLWSAIGPLISDGCRQGQYNICHTRAGHPLFIILTYHAACEGPVQIFLHIGRLTFWNWDRCQHGFQRWKRCQNTPGNITRTKLDKRIERYRRAAAALSNRGTQESTVNDMEPGAAAEKMVQARLNEAQRTGSNMSLSC